MLSLSLQVKMFHLKWTFASTRHLIFIRRAAHQFQFNEAILVVRDECWKSLKSFHVHRLLLLKNAPRRGTRFQRKCQKSPVAWSYPPTHQCTPSHAWSGSTRGLRTWTQWRTFPCAFRVCLRWPMEVNKFLVVGDGNYLELLGMFNFQISCLGKWQSVIEAKKLFFSWSIKQLQEIVPITSARANYKLCDRRFCGALLLSVWWH